MKKYFCCVAIAMLLFTFITGCTRTPISVTEYKEWYEALEIEQHEGFEVGGFKGEDEEVALGIECNYENLSGFNDLLKRHNEFVRNHPGYFPDDVRICFVSGENNSKFLDCYNKPGDYFGEVSGVGIEENHEIKYMSGNVSKFKFAYEKHKNDFSIPVLILTANYAGTIGYKDFEFLNQFSDVEQVIIYFCELDYDMEEVTEAVHEYCPGADVYEVVQGKELKKW